MAAWGRPGESCRAKTSQLRESRKTNKLTKLLALFKPLRSGA
jgi:hypothetical protein